MAVEYAAAAAAAAGLIGGLTNKPGKNKGSSALEKIIQSAYGETAPLRQNFLSRAFSAMQGGTDPATERITQFRRGAISGNRGQARSALEQSLARQGLLNTSVGNQQLAQFDQATAGLLTEADTSEMDRLIRAGESASFAGLQTGAGAAGTLAQVEQSRIALDSISSQQSARGTGNLLGLLLMSYLRGGNTGSSGSGFGLSGTYGTSAGSDYGIDLGL